MNLEHVERERNYCSVAHELKVPFTAVDANCSKCSRARESRLVRLSKECKHEQHGRRVVAISKAKVPSASVVHEQSPVGPNENGRTYGVDPPPMLLMLAFFTEANEPALASPAAL